jgi:hypothetical protein
MFKSTKSGILSRVLGADSVGEKRDLLGKTNALPSLFMSSDGKVGIGITNPTYKLEVSIGSGNTGIIQRWLAPSYDQVALYIDGSQARLHTEGTTKLQLGVNATPAMTIINGGNVGIGTTNPQYNFHTYTSYVGFAARIHNNSTSSGAGALLVSSQINNTSSIAQIFVCYSQRGGGNTEEFIVTNNGIVLVNTSQWTSSATQDCGVSNASGQAAFEKFTSSRRYKTNIKDYPYNTSWIYDLNPTSFTFINDKPDALASQSIGYIAEDVSKIAPKEFIFWDESDPNDIKEESVHYKLLAVPIIEEMKKLRTELQELKQKLAI